jgi:hypothetical protein
MTLTANTDTDLAREYGSNIAKMQILKPGVIVRP